MKQSKRTEYWDRQSSLIGLELVSQDISFKNNKKHYFAMTLATWTARRRASRKPMGKTGLDPPSTHQSLGNCSRPSHSWRVSSGITSSCSDWVLSPDPLKLIEARRFLMTAHASPHSPSATRSWKLLRGLESSLSLVAWYRAMSTRESPDFWDFMATWRCKREEFLSRAIRQVHLREYC